VNTKELLIAIISCFIFIQPIAWSNEYKLDTLYERNFDAEIENAVFSSYSHKEILTFYPKLVILKHIDEELSQGDWKLYKKEVILYDKNGKVTKTLLFSYYSQIDCSDNGNYFYVWTVVREKPEPYHPSEFYDARIAQSSFSVYTDEGITLWRKSPFAPIFDAEYVFFISPKDGSIIEVGATAYDAQGNERSIKAQDLYGLDWYGLSEFTTDWEYAVAISRESPNEPNHEPIVLFVDSLLNRIWQRKLDEHIGVDCAISPTGAYILAPGYTTVRYGGLESVTGYLFNKYGDLLMKIPNGFTPAVFSADEKYILAKSLTPTGNGPKKGFALIDIEAKTVLLEEEMEYNGAAVAPDGKVALLEVLRPPIDKNELSKMPIGEARERVKASYESSSSKILVLDTMGNTLYTSDDFAPHWDNVNFGILYWNGFKLIIGITDKVQNNIKILSVDFTKM
jgi:hypothetical protein